MVPGQRLARTNQQLPYLEPQPPQAMGKRKELVQRALNGSLPGPVRRIPVRAHTKSDPRWKEHKDKGKARRKGKAQALTSPSTSKKKKTTKRTVKAMLRAARTRAEVKNAPKKTQLDPPDSCGKAGDPHDLEGGALVKSLGHISTKRRRRLDQQLVGVVD